MAARLYATGACPTKKEASEAAGLHPGYFSMASNPSNPAYNPKVTALMDEIDQALSDKSVDMSAVLQLLGREAAGRMRELMKNSQNQAIQFKAAQDLLDRSPETSKIQKHQIATFSLEGEDAKELAAALVNAAKVRAQAGDAVLGDYVKIPIAMTSEEAYAESQLRLSDGQGAGGQDGQQPLNTEGRDEASSSEASEGPAAQEHAA